MRATSRPSHSPLRSAGVIRRPKYALTAVHAAAKPTVEALEARTFLSAAVVQPVGSQIVAQDTPTTIDLSTHITDPTIPGTLVNMQTSLGSISLELFDTATPQTVANFLAYVNNGLYNGTIIHRAVNAPSADPNQNLQIVQGGGFTPAGQHIFQGPTVPNEFLIPNTRGTIAMAKPGNDPNGATSEWYFNDGNNPGLDNPLNDGGFTVFGQVLSGLDVVDAIAGLPTADGTALNPALTNLPVVNAVPPGTTPQPSDMVNVTSVAVLPKLTYNATSDNIQLVKPTINGSQLTFNPAPGRSGIAHITVSGADQTGGFVTETFRVEVKPSAARSVDVTIGGNHPHSVLYRDANGFVGQISLGGPGTAVVHFGGDGLKLTSDASGDHISGSNVQVVGIDATGTTAASSLKVDSITAHSVRLRNDFVTVGSISTTGAFHDVQLIHAQLDGDLTVPGGVQLLRLDAARNGNVVLGGPARPGSVLNFFSSSMSDMNLSSARPIGSMEVGFWGNGDSISEAIQTPSVRLIHAFSNFSPGLQLSGAGAPGGRALGRAIIPGIAGGTWNIAGPLSSLTVGGTAADFNATFAKPLGSFRSRANFQGSVTAPSIGTFQVQGDMIKGSLKLTAPFVPGKFDLGTLSLTGGISGSTIQSAGNIGKVSALDLVTSTLFAGVGTLAAGTVLPQALTDFTAPASIAAVTLHPRPKAVGFSGSLIAAQSLGNLSLASTAVNNGGGAFGVAAHSIGRLTATNATPAEKFDFKNLTSASQFAAIVASQKLTLSDLQIRLV
ncbi:MAG: peptidyl-prolyl cis-trans isomerase (rotamase) - cyclophilin family [Phycisphaerales bacterium]|nr:peptidyl-prolyl cis-trans isomerase (rotamase) - cyclophilin family [Phycisphaerales bacterium]